MKLQTGITLTIEPDQFLTIEPVSPAYDKAMYNPARGRVGRVTDHYSGSQVRVNIFFGSLSGSTFIFNH